MNHSFFQAEERRFQILQISPEMVANLFFPWRYEERDGCVVTYKISGIPSGCRVEAVSCDPMRHVFYFRLWHKDFPEVPLGDAPPYADVSITEELLKVDVYKGREFI